MIYCAVVYPDLTRFRRLWRKFPLLIWGAIFATCIPLWGENQISNSSFEDSTLTAYSQAIWTGTGTIDLSNSTVHTGSQSLRISCTNGSATVWQVVPVPSNTNYRASVWLSTNALSGAGKTGLEIKSNSDFYYLSPDHEPNDGAWYEVGVDFNTGNASVLTVICSYEMYGNGTGIAYFDDLTLETESDPTPVFTLTFGEHSSGKPGFFLNEEEFNPVVLTRGLPAPSLSEITSYQNDGINILYLALFASSAQNAEVATYLNRCREKAMPVIVEYVPNFWNSGWLAASPSRNLQLSPDHPGGSTYVQHFPDYEDQEVKDFVQNEIETIVGALTPFHQNPIVAYSIGAYDLYHLPDGETHALFATQYPHSLGEGNQTWIPYGDHITQDFQDYLSTQGADPSTLGFGSIPEVTTPLDRFSANNTNHWEWWIRYRRYFVRRYTAWVTDGLRNGSGLPVTGTFDINFSLNDNFATPIPEFSDIFDFFILYYYDGTGIR